MGCGAERTFLPPLLQHGSQQARESASRASSTSACARICVHPCQPIRIHTCTPGRCEMCAERCGRISRRCRTMRGCASTAARVRCMSSAASAGGASTTTHLTLFSPEALREHARGCDCSNSRLQLRERGSRRRLGSVQHFTGFWDDKK